MKASGFDPVAVILNTNTSVERRYSYFESFFLDHIIIPNGKIYIVLRVNGRYS